MTFIAIGLNHRSAPLSVLEQVTFPAEAIPKALSEVTSSDVVNEAVVLSTCNRTEIYVHAERFHDAYRDVRDALALLSGVSTDAFVDHLYVHFDDEAIDHLFAVTAGLDSAVLGEHEILGQIRTSWESARTEGTAGPLLNPLFEHAVRGGKRVRTETAIGRRTASISHAAVSLVSERMGALDGKRVLLIGAGEVGAGVATAMAKSADVAITVINRTESRAHEVAGPIDGTVRSFDELVASVADADVVISATGSPSQVLSAEDVERAMVGREDRLLLLDLAVPRDIDPGVMASEAVDLLVLSDLQAFANRGLEERQKEAASARVVIADEMDRYRASTSARELSPLLGGMHRWAEGVRQSEVERHAKKLADLDADQTAAVEALTKALVAKIMHEPSATLRDAAGTRRGDRLAEAVRELFDLS